MQIKNPNVHTSILNILIEGDFNYECHVVRFACACCINGYLGSHRRAEWRRDGAAQSSKRTGAPPHSAPGSPYQSQTRHSRLTRPGESHIDIQSPSSNYDILVLSIYIVSFYGAKNIKNIKCFSCPSEHHCKGCKHYVR